MKITYEKFIPETESELLAKLLSSQAWPFHVRAVVSFDEAMKAIKEGHFSGEENQTFWIVNNESEKMGVLKLFEMDDLEDGSPLFDLRILNVFQGQGLGQAAVTWLTEYIFTNYPPNRIEGTTRADNLSMRKVFQKCGYAKEGHYRQSWPAANGKLIDTVRYAILKKDWQSGEQTIVNWNE
jgi:RimJ/RimL family protein N-acetyltransferase